MILPRKLRQMSCNLNGWVRILLRKLKQIFFNLTALKYLYHRSNSLQYIRRSLTSPFLGMIDNGFFGLTPLETHVVICGFP